MCLPAREQKRTTALLGLYCLAIKVVHTTSPFDVVSARQSVHIADDAREQIEHWRTDYNADRPQRNRTFVMWDAAECPPPGEGPGERDAILTRSDGSAALLVPIFRSR
jgi:hypothetical protein